MTNTGSFAEVIIGAGFIIPKLLIKTLCMDT